MDFSVVISFIVIFALVLASVGLGMKYFESRRKKHVTGMLQTVAGAPEITISNILKEEVDPNQSVVERMLTRFNFADKARSELQQAGMPWSPTKLVAVMGVGDEIGDPLGQEFRTLFNEQNLGAPMEVALRNLVQRMPMLDVRFFSSSVL